MKQTYSDLLKDPRWQKKRLEILDRDKFTCLFCSDTESTLHVHHLSYCEKPWDIENKYLLTLCEHCHTIVHSHGNLEIVDSGILSPFDFLLLDPILIYSALCYIENHKGLWTIQFRDNANPYQIIKITCLLYEFIIPVDNNIKICINWPDSAGSTFVDVFEYLDRVACLKEM